MNLCGPKHDTLQISSEMKYNRCCGWAGRVLTFHSKYVPYDKIRMESNDMVITY